MIFKNSTHQYIIDGENYKSFSSIIKLVEPEKNWLQIAEAYAKKHKRTVADVQAEWAENGRLSRERGTLFHSLKENEDISCSDRPVFYEETINDIKNIKNLETLEDGVYPELVLYNNYHKACGTADKVIIETVDGKRYVDIYDYKTSKTIDTESYYNNRTQEYARLNVPLSSVMDCNLSKYTLQLSMYAFFLEKYNFTPRHLKVIHLAIKEFDENNLQDFENSKYKIEHEGKKLYVGEETIYNVPYMAKEVRSLLNFHRNQL